MNWKKQENQSYRATDEDGNKLSMSASQETVSVRTKDGFTGSGWTAQDALFDAAVKRKQVLGNHNAELAKIQMKEWQVDDFEIEFNVNLAEDCETDTGDIQYYTLDDGRKVEIVAKSSMVKIDNEIVGKLLSME